MRGQSQEPSGDIIRVFETILRISGSSGKKSDGLHTARHRFEKGVFESRRLIDSEL
jgi:hypothetical protein